MYQLTIYFEGEGLLTQTCSDIEDVFDVLDSEYAFSIKYGGNIKGFAYNLLP